MRRLALAATARGLGRRRAHAPTRRRPATTFDAALDRGLAADAGLAADQHSVCSRPRARAACGVRRLFDAGASRLARDREGDTRWPSPRAPGAAVVDALIAGASRGGASQIDMPDAHGSTPLMLAIHAGRAAVARALLDAGADVDASTRRARRRCAEAAYAADEDIGARCSRKARKPDPLDRYGKAPICYAAARGAARLVAALLDAGVDVERALRRRPHGADVGGGLSPT